VGVHRHDRVDRVHRADRRLSGVVLMPPTLEQNEAMLNLARRIVDQHQSIIDANAKLLDALGYPLHIVNPEDLFETKPVKGVS
jgi:hypothetical protein